ncbi:MAG: hypothetical protein IJP95_07250 [Bacteroidales bacterium]|nr:hypothetical protein [Bacteroidales bacterium]
MKKVFLFSIMCLMAIVMNAQRCAVVGFKAGAKVSLSDIDGISETFSTYFRPQGYTMVDRLYIDKALAEQRIQRSSITEDLAVSAGKYMNVSKVVVGKVYISFDGGYQVDVTVLDVQSGLHVANDGTTVTPGNYRQSIQTLAKRLAGKIAIKPGQTVAPTKPSANNNTTTTQQRTTPYILYDYLKVFPNDLGTFDAEPKTVIAQLNKAKKYGYGTWRLPTNEEMALMRAENVVGIGTYMTKEKTKGIVRLVTDREKGDTLSTDQISPSASTEFVNLGLISGTLWKNQNELNLCEWNLAVRLYGKKLPTKEQWEELKQLCQWTWDNTNKGYKVVGPNGNSIFLPAAGGRTGGGYVGRVGSDGLYWSSTPNGSAYAWYLYFNSGEVSMYDNNRCSVLSVRLVQD